MIKALGITGTGAVLALITQHKANASEIALIGCAIPLFFWIVSSQWKYFQRSFYFRVAEIESLLSDRYGLCSPKIYRGWLHYFKRTPSATPKHRGYVWDGLLNRSVFVTYVLESV